MTTCETAEQIANNVDVPTGRAHLRVVPNPRSAAFGPSTGLTSKRRASVDAIENQLLTDQIMAETRDVSCNILWIIEARGDGNVIYWVWHGSRRSGRYCDQYWPCQLSLPRADRVDC